MQFRPSTWAECCTGDPTVARDAIIGAAKRMHTVAATLTLGLLPNVFMCIVNIIYNWIEIVDKLSPQDQRVFYTQIVGVNVIGYWVMASGPAFSATLTTTALDRRSLRWFGACP